MKTVLVVLVALTSTAGAEPLVLTKLGLRLPAGGKARIVRNPSGLAGYGYVVRPAGERGELVLLQARAKHPHTAEEARDALAVVDGVEAVALDKLADGYVITFRGDTVPGKPFELEGERVIDGKFFYCRAATDDELTLMALAEACKRFAPMGRVSLPRLALTIAVAPGWSVSSPPAGYVYGFAGGNDHLVLGALPDAVAMPSDDDVLATYAARSDVTDVLLEDLEGGFALTYRDVATRTFVLDARRQIDGVVVTCQGRAKDAERLSALVDACASLR